MNAPRNTGRSRIRAALARAALARAALARAGALLLLLTATACAQGLRSIPLRFTMQGGCTFASDDFTASSGGAGVRPFGGGAMEYQHSDHLAFDLSFGMWSSSGDLTGGVAKPWSNTRFWYRTLYGNIQAGVLARLWPVAGFTPIIKAHAGPLFHRTESILGGPKTIVGWKPELAYGIAAMVEHPVFYDRMTLRLTYDRLFSGSDKLDGFTAGGGNDGTSIISLGLAWSVSIHFGSDAADAGGKDTVGYAEVFPSRRIVTPGEGETPAPVWNAAPAQPAPRASDTLVIEDYRDPAAMPEAADGDVSERRESAAVPRADSTASAHGGEAAREPERPPERPEAGDAAAPAGGGDVEPAPPRGDDAAGRAIPKADCITTRLRVTDFSSLRDLESNPQAVSMQIEQGAWRERLLLVEAAVRRGDSTLAGSVRSLPLSAVTRRYEANQIFDFAALRSALGLTAPLETGRYTVRVSVGLEGAQPVVNEATFDHVDIDAFFGLDAPRVRYLISTGKVRQRIEDSGEILFQVFGDQRRGEAGPTASSCPLPASDGADRSPDARGAASIVPDGASRQEASRILAGAVRNAFARALSVDSWIKRGRSAQHPIGIVLAEVYFPFEDAELSEESRAVLELVSRELNRHPELVVEVRGSADDRGDAGYDQLLAVRRADRVFEYLGRRQVSGTRLVEPGRGTVVSQPGAAPMQRRWNRSVRIVLLTGK